jgi:hypothetical protein
MNHHTCNRIEHLHHYERNGTYHRVLLAIPTSDVVSVSGLLDDVANQDTDGITIGTTRVVILTAPTIQALDDHTARLQTAASLVDWELRSADGLHRRIIERLQPLCASIGVDQ